MAMVSHRLSNSLSLPWVVISAISRLKFACSGLTWCRKTVAMPKSESLSRTFSSRRRFSGLMSLWLTPFLCRYSRPEISWLKNLHECRHKKMSHKSCLEMFRPLSLVLGHPDIRLNPIEELSAAAVLQEDERSPALRPPAVALHHVLVLQQLVHTDLLLHAVLGLGSICTGRSLRVEGCKSARVQGCKGARVQGCKGVQVTCG